MCERCGVDRVAARRATGLLRRRRDGHQGARLDGPGVRAARVLLPRDRPQPAHRGALRAAGGGVRRRHRRRAPPATRSCCRPTGRRRRWSRPPAPAAATSSTRCARSSPRSTTRCASVPGRATASCTSVTRATRRQSARWQWRRTRSTGWSRWPTSTPSSEFDEPVALLAQTTLSHRDWSDVAVAVKRRFPDAWTPGRSDLCFATTNRQSALMALAEPLRRHRRDRLGELVEHARAREAGARSRAARSSPASTRPTRSPTSSSRPGSSSASRPARRHPTRWSSRSSPRLDPRDGVEVVRVTDEDEYFPPPRNLRELQSADRDGGHGDARWSDRRRRPRRRPQPERDQPPRRPLAATTPSYGFQAARGQRRTVQ